MLELLRRVVGDDSVLREPGGITRVSPGTTEAVAGVLRLAHAEGWRVAVEGGASWRAEDAPADVVLVTRNLAAIRVAPTEERVVTAGAGVALDRLRREALDGGAWVALDPPGRGSRTIGSILATATWGPLRLGFGPVRHQVLGLTVVTGDGRIQRAGGTAVRTPAGRDPVQLHVGGFGAFGVITSCDLHLVAPPQADVTWIAAGTRDRLTALARRFAVEGIHVAAAELLSPALAADIEWILAVRCVGTRDEALECLQRLTGLGEVAWRELTPERQTLLWSGAAQAVTSVPVTMRLGSLSPGLDEAMDLLDARLGAGMVSAGVVAGGIRWSGVADAERIREVRRELASREIPLTLERAPWRVRRTVGHFGPYRENAAALLGRWREAFDPTGVLVTALDAGTEP